MATNRRGFEFTGLARKSIPFLRLFHSLINLPFDPEMLRLTGYHFYYSAAKSTKELKLPPYRDAEQSVKDTVEWRLQAEEA